MNMKSDAIFPGAFLDMLLSKGVTFFAGVPDSLLKHFCSCVSERMPQSQHVITANEGSAVALAMGQQIGSGELPLVYMQNSGLGNAINPLLSLADELVYSIPMVLMIGWRGEMSADGSQLADEPQHVKQGRVTLSLLDAMGIPYAVISRDTDCAMQEASAIIDLARCESRPVALVVRKDSFAPYKSTFSTEAASTGLSREAAIDSVVKCLPGNAIVVATTGMASRELYELREARQEGHFRDFLTVGGMGHASQIALGIARARPEIPVVCFDGDGAFLMHMGGVPYTARQPNLIHVVLNNGCHDSVGGQRTLAATLDLARIATSCGFEHADRVVCEAEIEAAVSSAIGKRGKSYFVEIVCREGHRGSLGRPKTTPKENKQQLLGFLASIGVLGLAIQQSDMSTFS
jgi:phosphonopyruvate decarboxylase